MKSMRINEENKESVIRANIDENSNPDCEIRLENEIMGSLLISSIIDEFAEHTGESVDKILNDLEILEANQESELAEELVETSIYAKSAINEDLVDIQIESPSYLSGIVLIGGIIYTFSDMTGEKFRSIIYRLRHKIMSF